ncbi:hypothetical protein SUGI_0906310 [Cryptomeria japonica]|nr:hypothetical protein SUGI_0906310 [Cryptomeria japonica]
MSDSPLKYESSDGTSMTVNSESSSSSSPMWVCPSPVTGQSHLKVPFSWEKEPGIPKQKIHSVRTTMAKSLQTSIQNDYHHDHHHLRPPPILLSKPSEPKRKKKVESDPFAAAMVECTKHEKSKERSKIRSSSMFSWIRSCSTSDSEVILPQSKLLDRSRASRSNQVLDFNTSRKVSNENLSQFGPVKHWGGHGINNQKVLRCFGKENRQRESTALVEWANCRDVELYHTLLKDV